MVKKLKICQLTCVYPPYGGGIGYVAYHYARWLAARHDVTVATPLYHSRQSWRQAPGVTIKPLKPWLVLGKAALLPTIRAQLKNFDIVHLHYPFFGAHEWLPYLLPRQKLVVTFHMLPQVTGLKGKIFAADIKLFARALTRRADSLLCATRDYWERVALPVCGQAGRWHILPFGVEDRFKPALTPSAWQRQLKIKSGEQVLLFLSTLDQAHCFKGLDILLKSLAVLAGRPWRLVVVGGGNLKNHYARQAYRLGLASKVNFVGYVRDDDLPYYYQGANIFILPSVNQAEAFGLAALQAMACGLPVIASRLPGVRELVQDGEVGLLVTPGRADSLAAAIETLLNAPARARWLGAQGSKLARARYQWDKIGAELESIYLNLF